MRMILPISKELTETHKNFIADISHNHNSLTQINEEWIGCNKNLLLTIIEFLQLFVICLRRHH